MGGGVGVGESLNSFFNVLSLGHMRGSLLSLWALEFLEAVCSLGGVCSNGKFPEKVKVDPFGCLWKLWLALQLAKVCLWPKRPS